MSQALIEQVEAAHYKKDLPNIEVGDTVNLHLRIIEGEKERVQVFSGVIISIKGRGLNQTLTVRRIVANEGVERIVPIHSPRLAKIEVVRRGHTRRSKLYYLRDRVGKSRRLRDRRRGLDRAILPAEAPAEQAPAAEAAPEATEEKAAE
jgi:large subunit ribosomal protein L19